MLQAPSLERLPFGPFSLQQDGLAAPEVDIGGREVAEAFVIAAVIVVADERIDLRFEIARQVIVLQQDAVLERLVPAFDLALGHRMVGRAADVIHTLLLKPVRQIAGDIA